jgi:hypothetical protein
MTMQLTNDDLELDTDDVYSTPTVVREAPPAVLAAIRLAKDARNRGASSSPASQSPLAVTAPPPRAEVPDAQVVAHHSESAAQDFQQFQALAADDALVALPRPSPLPVFDSLFPAEMISAASPTARRSLQRRLLPPALFVALGVSLSIAFALWH